ncbi:MAG: M48 family metallopeptidase, partial [Burkholderiales bacterium]
MSSIARLEEEASRNPAAYRRKLAVIAIAGDFALTVTQVLPLAAPIVVGVLLIDLKLFYWLGAASVAFLAWVLRPGFRFQGRELKAEEAPRLHADIGRLKQKLHVPGHMRVYLDESFNASAAETRGWFGIVGTQCALTLGIPLLVALDREQVLAVIAHEFGHFSRRHGRFGHWLYRARAGWNQYAEDVGDSDSAFDRAAAWYARQFVPFFSARSFVHSRQCEYEADADAALAVGSESFASALTRIAVIARLWNERAPRQVLAWQLQSSQPPDDFYERFARCVQECSSADARSWLDDALREPSGWLDTHPSLSERLRSVKQDVVLAEPRDRAGEALLGEAWPKVLAEFNQEWTRQAQADWLVEHLRLKHLSQPLLAAGDEAAR